MTAETLLSCFVRRPDIWSCIQGKILTSSHCLRIFVNGVNASGGRGATAGVRVLACSAAVNGGQSHKGSVTKISAISLVELFGQGCSHQTDLQIHVPQLSDGQLQDLWYILVECSSLPSRDKLNYEDFSQVKFCSPQTKQCMFCESFTCIHQSAPFLSFYRMQSSAPTVQKKANIPGSLCNNPIIPSTYTSTAQTIGDIRS